MTHPDYDTDFYAWTQQQAQALRAQDWAAVDIEHVAEEIEDLWKAADHDLTMVVLAFLELIYRPCAAEEGRYYWQASVIAHHRAMLEKMLEDSPQVRPLLEGLLPEAYTWARERVLRQQTPPLFEPLETCPWPVASLLDEAWWPPEAPARLP
jgi:tagatose-1,6-bisphosphate aldolase non-catalytic subunit AgaZ/GatZ